jgi:hypothetical protein
MDVISSSTGAVYRGEFNKKKKKKEKEKQKKEQKRA